MYADFVRKRFNLLFSCFLFVIMYILTLSNVVHSFKFGCEANVGTGLPAATVFFVKEQTTSGVQLWRSPYCSTVREVMFSADILHIFMIEAVNCGDLFSVWLLRSLPHELLQL